MTASAVPSGFRGPLGALFAGVLSLLALAGCSVNPATGDRQFTAFMSPSQERQIGAQQDQEITKQFGGVYEDPEITEYVDGIGQRLAQYGERPELSYSFTVLDSDIVNAFALPGGYIYITRGLLAIGYDEAEIAGVIAHEIGHVTARHSAERYSQSVLAQLGGAVLGATVNGALANQVYGLGANLYLQSYSRDQEYEADSLGVRYLSRAGYDPYAMADFLSGLRAHSRLQAAIAGDPSAADRFSLFASHPRTDKRVLEAVRKAGGAAAPGQGTRARDRYLDAVDGMAYGGSRKQGFVRGRAFIHPDLRFRFEVPQGFNIINGQAQVSAVGRDDAALVFDMAPAGNARGPDAYLSRVWAQGARLSSLERITVNGMPAATAVTRRDGAELRLVAIQGDGGRMFRFVFRATPRVMDGLDAAFRKTTYSFERLSRSEAANYEPLRIDVVEVAEGETVESLARQLPFDDFRVERFRVLNGLNDGETLSPGQRVKVLR